MIARLNWGGFTTVMWWPSSAPASPTKKDATRKASVFYRQMLIPTDSASESCQ